MRGRLDFWAAGLQFGGEQTRRPENHVCISGLLYTHEVLILSCSYLANPLSGKRPGCRLVIVYEHLVVFPRPPDVLEIHVLSPCQPIEHALDCRQRPVRDRFSETRRASCPFACLPVALVQHDVVGEIHLLVHPALLDVLEDAVPHLQVAAVLFLSAHAELLSVGSPGLPEWPSAAHSAAV